MSNPQDAAPAMVGRIIAHPSLPSNKLGQHKSARYHPSERKWTARQAHERLMRATNDAKAAVQTPTLNGPERTDAFGKLMLCKRVRSHIEQTISNVMSRHFGLAVPWKPKKQCVELRDRAFEFPDGSFSGDFEFPENREHYGSLVGSETILDAWLCVWDQSVATFTLDDERKHKTSDEFGPMEAKRRHEASDEVTE
ncbi:hypothetical protein BT63DRAFT_473857 [Microthyrium microscopicum]|uniref:Uncharacterized protein n=1 Tax=Microthyrium microscopicum TaxID=703497 RepID=A0A6A6UQM9_9PEZI|nr:hypothetical protein BT63DRAFT_473857 [Microthyrium microscopicum]